MTAPPPLLPELDGGGARDTLAALALDLGFDAVGWADAAPRPAELGEYRAWLDAGLHGGLDYLERQYPRRADLSSSLPGAGAVLVLGLCHSFDPQPVPAGGVRLGRVARFAWTPDYHAQIEPLLERLRGEAERLGARARGYVDHGPVLERALAGRAFPGWRGKSGMLLSTSLGAFVTLAVLLTDLPAPPLPPAHPDRCGRCLRCVLSCPTGAILPGGQLDAGACISALTTEQRGPLPWERRAGVGEWLLGCDVCSEVCPWSGHAGTLARLLTPQPELAHPDLLSFFGRSERDFLREYGHTAFARPRRKGMARNAVTVVGNLGSGDGGERGGRAVLEAARTDPAWEVREAAAWAYGRWNEPDVLSALTTDPDGRVATSAGRALSELGAGSARL